MITGKFLSNMLNITASNFKFVLDDNAKPLMSVLLETVKNMEEGDLLKRFQQVWLMPKQEWQERFGYSAYPALSDWILLLTGDRPKTDEEKQKETKAALRRCKNKACFIAHMVNSYKDDERDYRLFLHHYNKPENEDVVQIINQITTGTKDAHEKFKAVKGQYLSNKDQFINSIVSLAKEREPLLIGQDINAIC